MVKKILNYSIKFLIIILGILMVSGYAFPYYPDQVMMKMFGAILIIWGIYRLIRYRKALKKFSGENNETES